MTDGLSASSARIAPEFSESEAGVRLLETDAVEVPSVSVLIAAYNAAEHIEACLDSVLGQDFTDIEVVVVDDCSTDDTWDLLVSYEQRDERVRIFRNDVRMRSGGARNRGLGECRANLVAIQDADDLSEPNRISVLYDYLTREPVDFVSCGCYVFAEGVEYSSWVPRHLAPVKTDFLIGAPFCHAATVFRRDCLEAVGGYRIAQETRRGQDYDLFMNLYAAGYRGANVQDLLYCYRVDTSTLRRRTLEFRLDECMIRWRGFVRLGLMPWGVPFVVKPLLAHLLPTRRRA